METTLVQPEQQINRNSGQYVIFDLENHTFQNLRGHSVLITGKFEVIQRFHEACLEQGWCKEDVYKVINIALSNPTQEWFIWTMKDYCFKG